MEERLNEYTLKDLYTIAKRLDIKYVKSYTKDELIGEIIKQFEKKKKERENKKINKIFPFDQDIIAELKKGRIKKIKCKQCGEYIRKDQMLLHKLNKLKLPELYNIAKELKIQYITRYKKAELIEQIIRQYEKRKKEEENKKINDLFPFDESIIPQKKKRVKQIKCEICGKYIKETRLQLHKAKHNPEPDFILVEVAFKGRLLTYQHNNNEGDSDLSYYMDSIKDKANNLIKNALDMHKNIKINLELECDFKNLEQEMTHKFQLPNVIIRGENDLINYWDTQRDLFISRCDELEAKGSG